MRKAKFLQKSLGMTSSLAKSHVLSMHATSFYSFPFSGSVSGQVLIINIVLANIYVRLFPVDGNLGTVAAGMKLNGTPNDLIQ